VSALFAPHCKIAGSRAAFAGTKIVFYLNELSGDVNEKIVAPKSRA
jgi:hypothetical protein